MLTTVRTVSEILSPNSNYGTHTEYIDRRTRSYPNKWHDYETATRLVQTADNRDELVFKRGLEGLLICDVASMIQQRYRHYAYTFPTIEDFKQPRVGTVEDSVSVWLERMGLTAREAQASMALEVLSVPVGSEPCLALWIAWKLRPQSVTTSSVVEA